MARLIAAEEIDRTGTQIVGAGDETLDLIVFHLLRLDPSQSTTLAFPSHETVLVPLSGTVDVAAGDERFDGVGGRTDVFSGLADSVFVPPAVTATVTARTAAEVAVAGAAATPQECPSKVAFRVPPDAVDEVDVGSAETHSRRRIRHILGQRQADRVHRLLVSELYADPGCWSGYPPHKHDSEDGDTETAHEELYHYRFNPNTGFGGQSVYNDGERPNAFVTRHGDTFLLDRGYHPTVTSPGHEGYIFTILAGRSRRGLIQRFEARHMHLVDTIPGIQGMRDKFK